MVPVAASPVRGGAVVVRDGRVAAVGPAPEIRAAHPDLPERSFGEAVLAPGFVDAHCHLEWSLIAPAASGDFAAWMASFLSLRRRMRPEDHEVAARLGALRRLAAGTTAVGDNGPTGAGAAALAERGMRGVVHLEAFGDPPPGEAANGAAAVVAERIVALDRRGVTIGLSPHAPYTVGPSLWAALARRTELAGRRWSTHLAESPAETRWHARGDGPLGVAYAPLGVVPARWSPRGRGLVHALEAGGALRQELVAAHCIWLAEDEPEALAARSVSVAHCPSSNRRLLCGRMPIGRLSAVGVNVALGTDSPASGGPFDLRVEARRCGDLHVASGERPSAEALVRMTTEGGARALGLEREIGGLAAGRRADAVVLAGGRTDDPWEAVLDPRAEVTEVMIGGESAWRRDSPPADAGPIETSAEGIRDRLC